MSNCQKFDRSTRVNQGPSHPRHQVPPARLDPSVPWTDAAVKDDEIVHLLDLPGRQKPWAAGWMDGWMGGDGGMVLFAGFLGNVILVDA